MFLGYVFCAKGVLVNQYLVICPLQNNKNEIVQEKVSIGMDSLSLLFPIISFVMFSLQTWKLF